jgi:hypothetical protein
VIQAFITRMKSPQEVELKILQLQNKLRCETLRAQIQALQWVGNTGGEAL